MLVLYNPKCYISGNRTPLISFQFFSSDHFITLYIAIMSSIVTFRQPFTFKPTRLVTNFNILGIKILRNRLKLIKTQRHWSKFSLHLQNDHSRFLKLKRSFLGVTDYYGHKSV